MAVLIPDEKWLVLLITIFFGTVQKAVVYHPGPVAPPTADGASFKPTISWLKLRCSTAVVDCRSVSMENSWKTWHFSQLFRLAAGTKVKASSVQVSAQLRSVPLLYFTTTKSTNHNNWLSNRSFWVTAKGLCKPEAQRNKNRSGSYYTIISILDQTPTKHKTKILLDFFQLADW